jgi:hypothetical protein
MNGIRNGAIVMQTAVWKTEPKNEKMPEWNKSRGRDVCVCAVCKKVFAGARQTLNDRGNSKGRLPIAAQIKVERRAQCGCVRL